MKYAEGFILGMPPRNRRAAGIGNSVLIVRTGAIFLRSTVEVPPLMTRKDGESKGNTEVYARFGIRPKSAKPKMK